MGNSRKFRRNVSVLYGRFAAEVQEHGPGGYLGQVEHDLDCPAIKRQSMTACRCSPEIKITKIKPQH
jgi:hypothetical protein